MIAAAYVAIAAALVLTATVETTALCIRYARARRDRRAALAHFNAAQQPGGKP